jgi:hypothetical protein
VQPLRIDVALQGPVRRLFGQRLRQVVAPVDAEALDTERAQRLPVRRPGLARVVDDGERREAPAEQLQHGAEGRGGVTREARRVERAGGGIEQRDAVGARLRLQRHVGREQLGERSQAAYRPVGPGGLAREAPCEPATAGVERERRADEADQRAIGGQATRAAGSHRPELHLSRAAPPRRRFRSASRSASPLGPLVREPHAHRLEREQQVGEQDRGIEAEVLDRAQRHFGREPGSCTAR